MCCRNHAIKSVLDNFLFKLRFPNENEMLKRSLHVSYYYVLFVNIHVQFLELNVKGMT